ncbi:gustatory receptor 58c [Musca autumnalis]|uniref:gustatory receptor 58c n=1 Tax=Musca autumnalis TaxID=221902 RepID=UPI003CEA90A0
MSLLYSSIVAYYCDEIGPLVVMKILMGVAYTFAYSSIICLSWLKRKLIHQQYYEYLGLTRRYFTEEMLVDNYELVQHAQYIFLKKFISSLCKIILLYLDTYEHYFDVECEYVQSTTYFGISLYYGVIGIQQLIVDINVILGLLLIDLSLGMLSHNLTEVERDIYLMNKARKVFHPSENQRFLHEKWRQHLNRSIEHIAREVMHLQRVAKQHLDIYEIPMLFLLLAVFISLINMMFNILVYFVTLETIDPFSLLFYLFIMVSNISNVMIFYNICESLQNTYNRIIHQVYRIGIYASVGCGSSVERDSLVLSLEMLLMQLRYRDFKVTICGLFEIRNRSGMVMIHTIVLNLMYLIQSVVQSID